MRVRASAPGKVAILGEYAVLEGAPALVTAIDRRVRVSLQSHAETYCSVTAPGLTAARGRFRLAEKATEWLEGDAAMFRLATHTIDAFLGSPSDSSLCRPFDLVLDSTELMDHGAGGTRKLGLGSSAALTVALCHALRYYVATHQDDVAAPDLAGLIETHAGFQGRRGSGLDVAASLHGGLIEYRRAPAPQATVSKLPADLAYCFVWTGREAATGRFLADIDRWRRSNGRTYRRVIATLTAVARAGAQAARSDDAGAFLDSLDEYVTALQTLGDASGTDILSAPHRRLRGLARQCGVVYKPCGAGGGDIGVGMSRDSGAVRRFRNALVAEDFQPLSLNSEREGVEARSGI